jgi:hypothetical protein
MSVLILRSSLAQAQQLTGLDWDGTAVDGSTRRMLYWSGASLLAMAPMTLIWRVFQRNQVSGVGDGSRYYTNWFWGNRGQFDWGSGYANSYVGCHPYPVAPPTGDGKFEISTNAADAVTRDDASSPYVTNNRWYTQAFRLRNLSGTNYEYTYWVDLPSTSAANKITLTIDAALVTPPSPALMMGQAPAFNGASWGGYSRFEEQNAIERALQFYAAAHSEANIVTLSGYNYDSEVLTALSGLSLSAPWYLRMNPTPSDVSDNSGNGHHPSWDGTARPSLWTGP